MQEKLEKTLKEWELNCDKTKLDTGCTRFKLVLQKWTDFAVDKKNIFEHIINHSEDCEAEMQWWYSQCINLFSSSLKVLKRDEKTKNVNKHTKYVNIQKRTCCSNLFVMQILLPSLPKKPTAFFLPINKNKTNHPKTTFKWPPKIILITSNLL